MFSNARISRVMSLATMDKRPGIETICYKILSARTFHGDTWRNVWGLAGCANKRGGERKFTAGFYTPQPRGTTIGC